MRMLTKLGCTLDVAENGREALDRLAHGHYDIVFMDCQMPVMDGFEATAGIRKLELNTGRRQVVIALTANAMPEDRARCLAAGMDDYLSKPIALENLRSAVERWSKPGAARPPSLSPASDL